MSKPKLQITQESVKYTSTEYDKRWGVFEDSSISEENSNLLFPRNFYPDRRFLNIKVKNKGKRVATRCEISIKLINRDPETCENPSLNEKSLCWANGSELIDIGSHNEEEEFNLLFTDHGNMAMHHIHQIRAGMRYCEIEKDKLFPVAWLGTKKAMLARSVSTEDNLCYGKFEFHVIVKSSNDAKITKHLSVRLDKVEYRKEMIPKVEVLNCNCPK